MFNLLSFVVWDVSPAIIEVGSFAVRWYGLLFALGFLVGQQILIRIYKWEGKAEKDVETLTIYMVVATVLGARLGHVIFYQPDYYLQNPLEILMLWKGGLASHGATIGILVAIYLYSKKATHQSYLYVLDRLVITIAFAGCLIRLGNLMNSEIVGLPTNFPTAFVFVNDAEMGLEEGYAKEIKDVEITGNSKDTSIGGFTYEGLNITIDLKPELTNHQQVINDILANLRSNSFFSENLIVPASLGYHVEGNTVHIKALGIPRHPAQLYEAISSFLIFILLFAMYYPKKEKLPEGRLFAWFVILIFGLRFLYEFLKEPQVEFEEQMVLNMGQILSIPLVITGILILLRTYRKKNEII